MELANRTALITGATAGIGLACAEALHAAGMRLVVTGRRPERIAELEARWPGTVGLAADITDPALPQRLIDLALEHTGRCDVVLNNAGIMTGGTFDTIDIELACRMVRVNVEAAYRMAYTALRHFQRAGEGHLINTTSVLGTKVRKGAEAYCGTKFAIEALSEGLRQEVARTKVRVSCVEPGLTKTELARDAPVQPEQVQGVEHPLQPVDVARAVVFMLQQPEYVTIPRLLMLSTEQEV
ncbi:MAG TPA: SDR family oxidoreductase [bacterium]|nr:SDR family oxidoreductase [bacterium]